MNQNLKTILKSVFAIVLFTLSITVFAVWQDPTAIAPGNNAKPPINTSDKPQTKAGLLTLDGLLSKFGAVFQGSMQIQVGSPSAGKVLTATDSLGTVSWTTPTAGSQTPWTSNIFSNGKILYGGSVGGSTLTLAGSSNDEAGGKIVLNPDIGSVGIGTTNPGATLDVNGTIKISGGNPGAGKVLTSDANGLASWIAPTVGGTPATSPWTLTGNNISNNNTGFVGIGTNTPKTPLNVFGSMAASTNDHKFINIYGNSDVRSIIFDKTDSLNFGGWDSINGGGYQNFMSILGYNGNVGIGTNAAPSAKLEVNGQLKITGGNPGIDKVLTSDAGGLASWKDLEWMKTNLYNYNGLLHYGSTAVVLSPGQEFQICPAGSSHTGCVGWKAVGSINASYGTWGPYYSYDSCDGNEEIAYTCSTVKSCTDVQTYEYNKIQRNVTCTSGNTTLQPL